LETIEVDGVIYCIEEPFPDEWHVFRCEDRCRVGRVRTTTSSMWLLEAELIELELFRSIVRAAIERGVLVDLPTD
jgi:hypothetical protein